MTKYLTLPDGVTIQGFVQYDAAGNVGGSAASPFIVSRASGQTALDAVLLASGVHSTTYVTADIANPGYRGAIFILNVTAVPGTDTVNFVVDYKDPASGTYINLTSTGAKSATGVYTILIYPGAIDTVPVFSAKEMVPLMATYRIRVVHSAGTSFTYSIGAIYLY